MPYTLVVIDVQPEFNPAADRVVAPIREEMQVAIQNRAPILLVEYKGAGTTLVKDAVSNYPLVRTVKKIYDSGAHEIEEAIATHKLPQLVRVTGVNTAACVKATVWQLHLPEIKVVRDCCWCISAKSHDIGIRDMAQLPNVQIVERLRVA